jgi:hypothetical protein
VRALLGLLVVSITKRLASASPPISKSATRFPKWNSDGVSLVCQSVGENHNPDNYTDRGGDVEDEIESRNARRVVGFLDTCLQYHKRRLEVGTRADSSDYLVCQDLAPLTVNWEVDGQPKAKGYEKNQKMIRSKKRPVSGCISMSRRKKRRQPMPKLRSISQRVTALGQGCSGSRAVVASGENKAKPLGRFDTLQRPAEARLEISPLAIQ